MGSNTKKVANYSNTMTNFKISNNTNKIMLTRIKKTMIKKVLMKKNHKVVKILKILNIPIMEKISNPDYGNGPLP